MISYTILEKFKKLKISTHSCLVINQNWKLFFTITSSQKDPDTGSGSEILDFQFEDPDPKLLISDPEHWLEELDPDTKPYQDYAVWIHNTGTYE